MFDDAEEPKDQQKVKKLTVKELQERVVELEVKLELARTEHVARMQESHRNAQLRIRDLGYFLREKESVIGALERRVKALEQGLPQSDTTNDLEERLRLARKELASAQRSLTDYEIFCTIIQEHAVQLWFKCLGQCIPLERGGVTYHIIGGNLEKRKAVPKVGEGATLDLSDEEVAYFQRYASAKLLELYGDQQPVTSKEQPHLCHCGCGREILQSKTGRPGEYYSGACRVRSHRQKGKEVVTKVALDVTKLPVQEIKPILKYPGSKARLAEWIISFFPTHVHYVEPYCGSAAVFFLKKPSEHEVLNDLNSSIVNLFRVIRSRGGELAQAIEMTPWSEEEYALVERNCTDGDEVEQARRFLIRCWQAHGGTLHQVSGWKHNGLGGHAYPVRLWRQLPSRLLAVVDRLKDAEIRNRPALEIIDYYNAPDCLIYCDPPYVLSTRGRKYYSYEMDDSQHIALLDALDAHKGPVVLSGYGCPLYDERLAHWQRVTLSAVAEHGKQRTEVLWLNKCASVGQQGRLFE